MERLLLVLYLGFIAGDASAQRPTGGIRGFAKDDTGGLLVGVTVEATSPARIGGPAAQVGAAATSSD